MFTNLKSISLIALATITVSTAFAADNLVVVYDTTPYGFTQLSSALVANGHTVNTLLNATAGQLAADLASNSYKNVFLWDVGTSAVMNAADTTALTNFWAAHNKNIVVDGRSYGIYFNGGTGDEALYASNVANTFYGAGGGVWVGTDDDPSWDPNANLALNDMGYNLVTNQISSSSLTVNNANPIMAGVNAAGLTWGWSAGQVPVGLQPNGQTLNAVAWDNNNVPLISSSIVPEPTTMAVLALALAAIGRRRKKA